jgi:glycine oxidase
LKSETHVLIIGGGLAGLSLALSLIDLGIKTSIIDQKSIGSGASGVPLALINPAAAKQANLAWNAERCMLAVERNLKRVSEGSNLVFYKKTGVLRPATDTKTLEAFRSSLQRHTFPNGWAEWLLSDKMDDILSDCNHAGGGLWLSEAFTVDNPNYLKLLKNLIIKLGGSLYENIHSYQLNVNSNSKWIFKSSHDLMLEADHIVHCTGSETGEDHDWNWLPVHRIKGQMSIYSSNYPLDWDFSIAAQGYLAHIDRTRWAVGSTFEHHFDQSEPDLWGQEYLERKVDAILPKLRTDSTLTSRWAGIRLGTPNRLPILGKHPILEGRWIFTGLGSKGLLYSAYLADELACVIHGKKESIAPEINVNRYFSYYID